MFMGSIVISILNSHFGNLCPLSFLPCQAHQMFINFIDLFRELDFDYIDFLYAFSVYNFIYLFSSLFLLSA